MRGGASLSRQNAEGMRTTEAGGHRWGGGAGVSALEAALWVTQIPA